MKSTRQSLELVNMEILHIVPLNSRSEPPVYVINQLESLLQHSFSSHVVGFRGSEISFRNPIISLRTITHLYKTIKHSELKIVHAHWGSLLGAICGVAKRPDQSLILTLRGSDVNRVSSEPKHIFLLRSMLSRIAVTKSSYTIYVSEQLNLGWKKNDSQFSVIPDGTHTDIFFPRSKDQTRHQLNWNTKKYYILFHCGERPKEKNLSLAKHVYEIVDDTLKNVEFIVIENDLTQEEIAIRFCAADVLIFTSHAEGSPNIVREALASGCPVVSVEVGDVSKWIRMSNAGQVCSYDPFELSRGVIDSITSRVLPDGSLAQLYSLKTSSESLANIYLRFGN
jgi:teichuronic acid biosynthesis glycosyltransferase TuaC